MWRSASREGRGWRSAQTTDARRRESVMQHKCKMQCTGNAMQNDVDEQWRPEGREFEGEDYNNVRRNEVKPRRKLMNASVKGLYVQLKFNMNGSREGENRGRGDANPSLASRDRRGEEVRYFTRLRLWVGSKCKRGGS